MTTVARGESDATRAVTLLLVRHGETADAAGRCVGQSDLELSSAGRASLEQLALTSPTPTPTRIFASDLARARHSAAILATRWASSADTVTLDSRLREMSFGAWDGRRWAEIERDDRERLAGWMADWQTQRVPGGEGFGDLIARVGEWLADAVRDARRNEVDTIAVVAHAGSIRALLVHALGLPRALAFRLHVDHARVSALRVSGNVRSDACEAAELLVLNADRALPSR